MAVVYPKEGRVADLDLLRTPTYRVMLFQNDITPDLDTVLADLDPCDFSGYAEFFPTWSFGSINGDDNGESTTDEALFLHDGGGTPNDVYGWALWRQDNNKIIFCERFAGAPIAMAGTPDEIRVTVRRTQGDCP